MLNHNTELVLIRILALLLLAGCASQSPSLMPVATPLPEQTNTVPAAAAGAVTAVVPAAAMLTPALEKVMADAARLMLAGQEEQALGQYAQVQRAAPQHVSAWLNAALIKRKQKKLPEALALIDSALAQRPNEARTLDLKGLVLREQGKIAEAKAAYLAAVKADDNYPPAHRNLAVLADLYLDEPVLALRHMERYAALVGDNKQVNSWLGELRRRAQNKPEGATP